MKKWIIRIILAIVVVGAFAGAGFAGYRLGLSHGMQLSGNFDNAPRFTERFHEGGMPGFAFNVHKNDRAFQHGFDGPRVIHGRDFGRFSPLSFLVKAAVLGLVIWGVYKLITGNGWQLSFTRHPVETPASEPAESRVVKKPKGKQ